MNFFGMYLSRVLAFFAIGILMLGIQTLGAGLRQRRDLPGYERLGAAVSDRGRFETIWWLWPPQLHLSGSFRGRPFRFEKIDRRTSHLLLECRPNDAWQTSRRRAGRLPAGLSDADLEHLFPGWLAFYASRDTVPWRKRSLDRRPPGLGSAPGIDLYRQTGDAFDARWLQSDLQGLDGFCADAPDRAAH